MNKIKSNKRHTHTHQIYIQNIEMNKCYRIKNTFILCECVFVSNEISLVHRVVRVDENGLKCDPTEGNRNERKRERGRRRE